MKKKSLFLRSGFLCLCAATLSGCVFQTIIDTGDSDNQNEETSGNLVIWVGSESVGFYKELATEFKTDNPDFGYTIDIVGADAGTAASSMIQDNTAVGDVVTIAHDNIGKLSQMSYIAPIIDDGDFDHGLLSQIYEDNSDEFLKAITNTLGDPFSPYSEEQIAEMSEEEKAEIVAKSTYTFAVPYISQALFLYYDTRYVSAEQAKTFEGLLEAAKAYDASKGVKGTKSYITTGDDGFNFSFSLLARNITEGNVSHLRLYENGEKLDCYNQDNDQVAVMRWMQRSYADPNGTTFELTGSSWDNFIKGHKALSVIGGAWHFNAFKSAVGEENVGCAIIPTFTLTDDDVAGIDDVYYPDDAGIPEELRGQKDPAPKKGDVFRGGSFVDCKCFVINMASINAGGVGRYKAICRLLKFFSSKEVQQRSFVKANNVPAYKGSEEYISTLDPQRDNVSASVLSMAKAQTGMNAYGFPQPFITGTLNTYYYSKNGPKYYVNCMKKAGDEDPGLTINDIRRTLFKMEYVWKHGQTPAKDYWPEDLGQSYPAETSSNRKKSK